MRKGIAIFVTALLTITAPLSLCVFFMLWLSYVSKVRSFARLAGDRYGADFERLFIRDTYLSFWTFSRGVVWGLNV
jgi:hypothetical protein